MRAPAPTSATGSQTAGFPGVGGGVGVVRMENLEAASRQLARNAAYGKHGPGVCTATAAHSKFIAVGTTRGLILLFDHFQARHLLIQVPCTLSYAKSDTGYPGEALWSGGLYCTQQVLYQTPLRI